MKQNKTIWPKNNVCMCQHGDCPSLLASVCVLRMHRLSVLKGSDCHRTKLEEGRLDPCL